MTNRQIASKLSISEHTAATHVRRILKKLGLQSRAQIGSWLSERQRSIQPRLTFLTAEGHRGEPFGSILFP